jgi:hypothetical protein
VELFQHRFDAIGSLYSLKGDGFHVGHIVRPSFYVNGRDKLQLERGPFPTSRAYFVACAQRELDCARTQSTQDTSDNYQRDVEDARLTVERSMMLLLNAIRGCRGLDDDDPELAPFSLSLVDLDLSKIYVSPEDPSRIVRLSQPGISELKFTDSIPGLSSCVVCCDNPTTVALCPPPILVD